MYLDWRTALPVTMHSTDPWILPLAYEWLVIEAWAFVGCNITVKVWHDCTELSSDVVALAPGARTIIYNGNPKGTYMTFEIDTLAPGQPISFVFHAHI